MTISSLSAGSRALRGNVRAWTAWRGRKPQYRIRRVRRRDQHLQAPHSLWQLDPNTSRGQEVKKNRPRDISFRDDRHHAWGVYDLLIGGGFCVIGVAVTFVVFFLQEAG